jgi:hypothetical protein
MDGWAADERAADERQMGGRRMAAGRQMAGRLGEWRTDGWDGAELRARKIGFASGRGQRPNVFFQKSRLAESF